jgi:hypothetical protein
MLDFQETDRAGEVERVVKKQVVGQGEFQEVKRVALRFRRNLGSRVASARFLLRANCRRDGARVPRRGLRVDRGVDPRGRPLRRRGALPPGGLRRGAVGEVRLAHVRRRLERERGISTWPDPTVGYKLCTTAEQLRIPVLRARRAIRQVRRGRRSVEALPEKSLTVNQRRARAFLAERSRESELSLRRDARQLEKQARPTPVQPRRRVSAGDSAVAAR